MGKGKSEWVGVASPFNSSYGFKGKPPLPSFLKPYLARFPFEAAVFWPGHIEKRHLRGPPYLDFIASVLCQS